MPSYLTSNRKIGSSNTNRFIIIGAYTCNKITSFVVLGAIR